MPKKKEEGKTRKMKNKLLKRSGELKFITVTKCSQKVYYQKKKKKLQKYLYTLGNGSKI